MLHITDVGNTNFVGGGICPPCLWLAPLGYAENSILHVNQLYNDA